MDVDDDFINLLIVEYVDEKGRTKQVISNSQLYKMAGNSIVVNCLYLIFRNLFYPGAAEIKGPGQGVQLQLF